jgi:tetratricopeptide (TPR) repeat protein
MRFSYVADHFQYHASIALIVLVVCGIASRLNTQSLQRFGQIAVVLALLMMGWITATRCTAYTDGHLLWLDTLEQNPKATIAIYNLGGEALNDKRPADALALFNMAVIACPDRPLPYINRAAAYAALEMPAKRLADLRHAIACFTDYEPERAMPHMVLGNDAMDHQQWAEAAGEYEQYVRCLPKRYQGYAMLGKACLRMGQLRQAADVLQKAIALGDHHAGTWYNLALAYQQLEQPEQAATCYLKSLDIEPKNADAMTNLAALFAQAGQFDKAIDWQTRALAINTSPRFLQNMVKMRLGYAMQLAQSNQRPQAVEQLHLVQKDAKPLKDAALDQRIEKMIKAMQMQP